ncbi:two component system histidine kinase [Butyrivibrio proteoclasticus B316]|uniref:histidine kinase n=1 Tax=Butyrivibrio proteoclasticus (strain ATCC 51982 / DSM 14932 / B316) TaxID=515622 RepID=E0S0D3_BUTPB|nr:two component system histidine kinase [Butyrivibrio proteoclasticus B316]
MLGKNKFWEKSKVLIVTNALQAAVLIIAGVLYNIESEFLFYEISFLFLLTAVAIVINYRQNKEEISETTEKKTEELRDTRWEQMREKEDFFALWAHQIKTPIAALKLLFQDEEPSIGDCKRELFKIENYVSMALNYLRFDDMSGDLVLERCQLEPLIKQVVKKFSTIFIYQHLTVEFKDLDKEILTDEKWFSFVLEQVLSNALKYTKTGGIKIFSRDIDNLDAHQEIFSRNGIEIVIRDTGVGIKSEDLPRVFEKGYTGYNGRIDKKASGLGLYMCKGVCDKLGHKIRIESEVGRGTDVIITVLREKISASDVKRY